MAVVIISGALANKPLNGGNAWSRLSWAQGFEKLGFKVYFVEQIARDNCVDAAGAVSPFNSCINLAYFKATMAQFGLSQNCALIYRMERKFMGSHSLAWVNSRARPVCFSTSAGI
jgi:hypothetical protein